MAQIGGRLVQSRFGQFFRLHERGPRLVLTAALCSLLLAAFTWQRCGIKGCPNVQRLTSYQPNGATVLLDRNQKEFADLAPVQRRMVSLDSLPAHVINAFLAVEDKRFYDHNGVDWRRVGGAMFANLRLGRKAQGSSTISMQLARNLYPNEVPGQERTFRRKLLEVRVARAIENRFEKREILELYLNHIYFGNGAYGVEAAAQHYFRRPARKLLISQGAMLAAMPKAPSHYDPRRRPQRAKERRNLVLTLMEQQGKLDAKNARDARAAPLRVQPRPRRNNNDDGLAPYFVETVRRQLEDKFGDMLYERRLRVYTTLDSRAQRAAEEELFGQLRALDAGQFGRLNGPRYVSAGASGEQGTRYLQGSMVLMEVATGDVVALVGGRDFGDSNFNRAINGQRQIGSAFKPFVYAAALQSGVPTSKMLLDEPLRMETTRRVAWEPRNYDGQFYGQVLMRDALIQSRNIPTIRLAVDVGLGNVKGVAQKAGLAGRIEEHPAMALGTVASNPLELARAYSVFPGLGERPEARYITRVQDEDGDVLWEIPTKVEGERMDPRVAYVVTHMLRDAVDRGTGSAVRSAGFYGTAAGKTGTTNEGADAWFVGYTPELVGAVWIGFDQQRAITGNASGGRLAAPVWGRVLRRVYANRSQSAEFTRPDGVVNLNIDPSTGLVLEEGCWPSWNEPRTEIFIAGNEPDTACPNSGGWLHMLFNRGVDEVERELHNILGDSFYELDGGARDRLRRYLRRALEEGLQQEHIEAITRFTEDWIQRRDEDNARRGRGRGNHNPSRRN